MRLYPKPTNMKNIHFCSRKHDWIHISGVPQVLSTDVRSYQYVTVPAMVEEARMRTQRLSAKV